MSLPVVTNSPAKRILLAVSTAVLLVAFSQPLRSQDPPAKPAAAAAKPKATARPAVKEPKDNEMGHVHYLDYRNGFRGVKFGSPASSISGLELVRESGSMKIYRKSNETLSIGEAQMEKILYHFVDDKFMGVSLFPKDPEDGHALQQVFEIAFGTGAPNKPHAEHSGEKSHADEFFWKGKVANARIAFNPNHEAEAWIGNNELQDQHGKVQKKMAEEAAASLN